MKREEGRERERERDGELGDKKSVRFLTMVASGKGAQRTLQRTLPQR